MQFTKLLTESIGRVVRPRSLIVCLMILAAASAFYPSDLASYTSESDHPAGVLLHVVNDYGRFIDTLLQVALPVIFRDPVGAIQLACVAVSTTVLTQGAKRAFNNVAIGGTRLGQRPSGPGSKHNMPSGHSSMASCAVWFVCRRYGMRFAWAMMPILALTMYARVALGVHTISAVLCGALVGFLAAAFFTSRYAPGRVPEVPGPAPGSASASYFG